MGHYRLLWPVSTFLVGGVKGVTQQYTLSAASRNLKIDRIWSLTEEQAYEIVKAVRFADTFGKPVCPHCGCEQIQVYHTRRIFKCVSCRRQFSVTSGTLWASRKMSYRRLLLLTAYFVMNSHGRASSRLGRDIGLGPFSAYIGSSKMREAMAFRHDGILLRGVVEIDGCVIGGHRKKHVSFFKRQKDGTPPKLEKRYVVCTARERGLHGRILTAICKHEREFVEIVRNRVDRDAELHTDEASHWQRLGETFPVVKVIKHAEFYFTKKASTNAAESVFAGVRRGQRGVYGKIAGVNRDLIAAEQGWRREKCRVSDAEQYLQLLRLCLTHPQSRRFCGYWQRGGVQ